MSQDNKDRFSNSRKRGTGILKLKKGGGREAPQMTYGQKAERQKLGRLVYTTYFCPQHTHITCPFTRLTRLFDYTPLLAAGYAISEPIIQLLHSTRYLGCLAAP